MSKVDVDLYLNGKIKDWCEKCNTTIEHFVEYAILNTLVELDNGTIELPKEYIQRMLENYAESLKSLEK